MHYNQVEIRSDSGRVLRISSQGRATAEFLAGSGTWRFSALVRSKNNLVGRRLCFVLLYPGSWHIDSRAPRGELYIDLRIARIVHAKDVYLFPDTQTIALAHYFRESCQLKAVVFRSTFGLDGLGFRLAITARGPGNFVGRRPPIVVSPHMFGFEFHWGRVYRPFRLFLTLLLSTTVSLPSFIVTVLGNHYTPATAHGLLRRTGLP